MLCLVAAKVANVYVPIFYKKAVDLLTGDAATIAALPIALLLAYGGARVLAGVFAELRDALFAKVAQRAIRNAAPTTFRPLPAIGLPSLLERRPGGLSRVIKTTVNGPHFDPSLILFNI